MKFEWFFPKANMGHQQGNRADISLFDKPIGIVQTVVREAIQNSLDAKLGDNINMAFKVHKVAKRDLPDFDGLTKHLDAIVKSKQDFSQNIKEMFRDSLKEINSSSEIEVLEIADFQTSGLGGINFQGDIEEVTDKSKKAWTRLLFQQGIQESTGLSGGSYGFGKLACFHMSKITSVFYSTLNKDNEYGFIGKSMIPDHKLDNEYKTAPGFWSLENADPNYRPIGETNFENIPKVFRRSEVGTSIFVLCPKYDSNASLADLLRNAVLMNYYPALHAGLLKIRIVDDVETVTEISRETISSESFLKELEAVDLQSFIRLKCIGQVPIEKDLEFLGKCRFYLYEFESKDGKRLRRIECFRLNGQVVHTSDKRRPGLVKSFIAVFECRDKQGNMILSMAENETHDEWGREAFDRSKSKVIQTVGKPVSFAQIFGVYEKFVNECLDGIYGSSKNLTGEVVRTISTVAGASQLQRKERNLSTKSGSFAIFRGGATEGGEDASRVDTSTQGETSGLPTSDLQDTKAKLQGPGIYSSQTEVQSGEGQKAGIEQGTGSEQRPGDDFKNETNQPARASSEGSGGQVNDAASSGQRDFNKSTVTKKRTKINRKLSRPDLGGNAGKKSSEPIKKNQIAIYPVLVESVEEGSFTYRIIIKASARGIVDLEFFAILGDEEEKISDIEIVQSESVVSYSPARIEIKSDTTSFEIKTQNYYQMSVKGVL